MPITFKQKPLREYRKVMDRKAPRMSKAEFTYDVLTKELYEKWKKENPKFKHFSFSQFEKEWLNIAQLIWKECSENTDGVRLPFFTGEIAVKYVTSYKQPIDNNDNVPNEIAHLNWNSNGRLAKIVWTIQYSRKFNKYCRLFCFQAYREFQQRVSKALNETPEIFKHNRFGDSNKRLSNRF